MCPKPSLLWSASFKLKTGFLPPAKSAGNLWFPSQNCSMLPNDLWMLMSTTSPALNVIGSSPKFIKSTSVILGDPPFRGSGRCEWYTQLPTVDAKSMTYNGTKSTCVNSADSSICPAITEISGSLVSESHGHLNKKWPEIKFGLASYTGTTPRGGRVIPFKFTWVLSGILSPWTPARKYGWRIYLMAWRIKMLDLEMLPS